MKVNVTKNGCNELNKNKMFWFQCGLIVIKKETEKGINELKKIYENVEMFHIHRIALRSINGCKIKPFNEYNCYCYEFYGVSKVTRIESTANSTYQTYYKSNKELKLNNCVNVCIEYIINKNKYYLYFEICNHENNNTNQIVRNNKTEDVYGFEDGKIELDFDKYDYLYALSCRRCGCSQVEDTKDWPGFECEVAINCN